MVAVGMAPHQKNDMLDKSFPTHLCAHEHMLILSVRLFAFLKFSKTPTLLQL